MINKYSGTEKDIHLRIHEFVIKCFTNIVQKIPKSPENIPIIRQISASLTSIGANDQEANACESNKDFIAKYTIVKKEANETIYWLNIIADTGLVGKKEASPYLKEANEIFLIISKIISNSKTHTK
jgi:four helix bundle protein